MDIWLLAILICALLIGWLMGRFSVSSHNKTSSQEKNNCSESYIQGLNYLLANKADKAIQLFVDLIKVDKETIETHLALGNLFRSKGEVDRAIKIHQNLIARPNLDQNQRVMALTELAEDYLKAGLLDRAENLYKELVQINEHNTDALWKLFELYSLEKSWFEAKDIALGLYEQQQSGSRLVLTHCYCEMAELTMAEGNLRETRKHLDIALQIDSQCVRALLLLVNFQLRDKKLTKALQLFNQLMDTSPQFIEIYLEPAREIFLENGSVAKYQQFLVQQYKKQPISSIAMELLKSYRINDQHPLIVEFLDRALQQSASIELFDFALQYFKNHPELQDWAWDELAEHFKKINNKKASYLCSVCGYGSHSMQWNCPSCKTWSSIRPLNL
jgi:lipopolysaccharide biosynthesis regulator YciM